MAVADLWSGLVRYELWWVFAVHDIKQRFRRSVLGPFWLTLSMCIMVVALGFVFSRLFGQNIGALMPYLAIGLIFWGLINGVITESCTAFVAGETYVRNVPMPLSVHFYRVCARNGIVWLHNMVIYVGVVIIFQVPINAAQLLFIPGFVLLILNLAWLGMVAAILSTRYRDIPPIITSLLQIVFFVTPIFWSINSLPSRPAFVIWNPLYHLVEIVRAPLLGTVPALASWAIAAVSAVIGLTFALMLYRRAYGRLPYWV